MIFFPVSQQPRGVQMISAWTEVPARTNRLAIAIRFNSIHLLSVGYEVKVEPRGVRELQAALDATLLQGSPRLSIDAHSCL